MVGIRVLAMQIFDPWSPKRAASLPVNESMVRYVLAKTLKSILIHLGLCLIIWMGVGWFAVSLSGIAAIPFQIVSFLSSIYLLMIIPGLYGHIKTRKRVLRDYIDYQDRDDGGKILWYRHRDIFLAPWGSRDVDNWR